MHGEKLVKHSVVEMICKHQLRTNLTFVSIKLRYCAISLKKPTLEVKHVHLVIEEPRSSIH